MKNVIFYLVFCSFLSLVSCVEKELTPISKSKGKPGVVTNVEAEPLAGGVKLTYLIPKTEDILAVKAVYTLSNGKEAETVCSYYDNSLTLLGYYDQKEHTARLFTVNRAQELSDPVTVRFTPLESPLSKLIKTVHITSDFGGASFTWVNEDRAPITFELFAQDSIGQMLTRSVFISDTRNAVRTLRGFKSVPWRFAAIASDRFGNRSDSIFPPSIITPLFEERLDKSKMKLIILNNDVSFSEHQSAGENMLDDDKSTVGHTQSNTLPAPFTIDLGVTAYLSRIVIFNRNTWGDGNYYNWGNPKTMTIWVRSDLPSFSGDWNEWTKVMDVQEIKPSGSPGTNYTDEDLSYALKGFDFSFPSGMSPVRYVRVVVNSTWENTTFTHIAEVDFYGDVLK